MKCKNELSVLNDLSCAIVGVTGAEDVCNKVVLHTAKLLNVDKVSIMKLDADEKTLKIVAAKGLPKEVVKNAAVKVGTGISGHVFQSAKPVLIKDIRASGFKSRKRYIGRSLMSAPVRCFPMHVHGEPIGVINVTDKKGGGEFTKEDLQILSTIANQTAAYLHLCDLAEKARSAESLKRELDIARKVQKNLLPARSPKIAGFDVAGKCMMAEHVGGDYFDYLIGGARPPAIVVADVSGHSISAAMTMSAFRSAVRSNASSSAFSTSLAVERLNALVYDDLSAAEQFISLVYLQIIGKTIKYTTAGHYPPLIIRGNSSVNHSTEDILLGVEQFAEYHEKRFDLIQGDVVVLYTDGLVDAVKRSRRNFSTDIIKKIIVKYKKESAEKLARRICSLAGETADLRDDVTVVILKRL